MRTEVISSTPTRPFAAEVEHVSGGEAVIRTLQRAGVEVVFGMPGVDNLPIYDALLEADSLRHILVRHEQGAGFMADGYARAARRLGVCLTTTGPGALNAATPLAAAHADGSPVLLIASQTESNLIGRGKGPSHDMRDQLGVFRSITTWARRVDRVEVIPHALQQAIRATQRPRPGPAYLEIPADVLAARADVRYPPWRARRRPRPSVADVRTAVAWLAASERPVVIAGGGVRWSAASAELTQLAERLGAPVLTTTAGKGAISENHPLSFGVCWGRWSTADDVIAQADMVLAVGTRLGAMDTRSWSLRLPDRLIHLDIDPTEIGRNYPAQLGLVGDARATLRLLLDAFGPVSERPCRPPWLRVDEYRDEAVASLRGRPELNMVQDIASALPPSCLIINDAPTLGYWLMAFWRASTPDSFMAAAFGSLGFAFPAALGARVAEPDRPILVVCGDGGLLFTSQEMATAIREALPVVVLVINDASYGSVRIIQQQQFDGRTSQVQLTNPDFLGFAQSFGFAAVRISKPSQVVKAVRDALGTRVPQLIELAAHFGLPPLS
jgi:thiamine pyrophosphate-dependent acetolactate synthase large subunit-like protein